MSRESKATKEEIQRNRDEAYQNGWGDGYAEGFGKATEAAIAALPARGVGVDIEDMARTIYDAMRFDRKDKTPEWVNGGNSHAQVEARAAAARILAALSPTDAAHVNETPKSEHDAGNVLTDAAQAPAEDAHVKGETAGQMLERLGMDGAKWAAEFRTTALRLGYSDMDEGWLIGWFCNAIMAGYDRSAAQAREAALKEAAAVADEHTFGGAAVRDAILALLSEART